jgi:DNA polymerase-4
MPHDTPEVRRANPVDSLDWPDYVEALTAETYQSSP